MDYNNGTLAQRSLLLDDPDSKTKSDVLSVLYARSEDTGLFDRDSLFGGFDTMRALTYSASIPMIMGLLRDYDYDRFECIFGHGGILGRQPREIIDFQRQIDERLSRGFVAIAGVSPERRELLHDRVADGRARFFVVKDAIAHAKIYLLEREGLRRVIVGSANLSETAFSGRQAETLIVYDNDDVAWEHYRGQYGDVLDTAVSALEVRDKPQVAAIIPIEEAPIFRDVERTGREVTMYVPQETEQEAEYGAANILVSVNNVPNVQRAAMPDLERGRNGSPNITVTPAIVRQARRMPVARPVEEDESGALPSLSYNRRGVFTLQGSDLKLDVRSEDVSRDARLLLEFFNNYEDDFVGDVERLQRDYFGFMSWFYFAPFMCDLRNANIRQGLEFQQPMFAILYGRSDCGKSSLTNTLMTSMFGYGKKGFVPNSLFTPSRVRGLRQEFRRHPVVFDDVSNNRFRQYADEVVKDGEISHGDEYPCVALLMNMDTRRFKPEIIKRSMMIYTQTSLPGNRPAARERLQASVSRIQDTLTTAFYRQYLKDMSTILETMPEETYRSVDVLQVSSNLLCRLFERSLQEGTPAPVWLEPVTLSGVQSRAYERSEKVLLGLLSADRYTKERHPPTGQWTLSGRHVLIGVDTRSLRDLREDIPNWVIDDAASVSDQIVLDHDELEEFLKSPVRKPSRWLLGLGRR